MSAAHLMHACPVCGAEESLDALLARMVDDSEARALVAEVISISLPLGTMAVRYLRIHTPPKQKLRLATVKALLAELVPDMQRAFIERKGRVWPTPPAAWSKAFQAVFDAHERGTLAYPLRGNAYLYEVLMRQADKAEAAEERQTDDTRRHRPHVAAPTQIGAVLSAPPAPPPGPRSESPTVRRMKAELAARAGTTREEAQP